MLQFCEYLYADVKENVEEWSQFVDYGDNTDFPSKQKLLTEKLEKLKALINERREWFGEDRCFL